MDARVERAAQELDRGFPDWFRHIDTGRLQLSRCSACIMGQLAQELTGEAVQWSAVMQKYGLDYQKISLAVQIRSMPRDAAGDPDWAAYDQQYAVLQDSWIEAIADRLHPVSESVELVETIAR